jgi:hypothetical protein
MKNWPFFFLSMVVLAVGGLAAEPKPQTAEDKELAAKRKAMAAAVAVSPLAENAAPTTTAAARDDEAVALAKAAGAAEVDGKTYDLVVVGGTGSGVLCAVRAAREGLRVLIVQHNGHLGGMMANGLMQWDALYGGPRAPLFTELLRNIERHYIETSGRDSADHQVMRLTHEHYPVGWAEPHVAEREFNRLLAGEKNATLLLHHYPVRKERDGRLLGKLTLREYGGANEITVAGESYVDATYEGDLLAVAKLPYRVGREARAEYGEPHAGKVFTNISKEPAPREAVEARLNLRPYNSSQGSIDPESPFSADGAVQAYNYRFCVTREPANRILLTEPPPGYRREEFLHHDRKAIATNPGPRLKSHMNSPILPGENHGYPEADWPAREKIIQRHRDFALGLMWFLQNDESVKAAEREKFRAWGLPADEFRDHVHIPYEMYVREARRLVGRHVYKEQDNSLARGFARTPVMGDSIAITDWYMDSHSCTTESRPGYRYDGKLILTEESRPGQIPYRALLPKEVDNLLVPVCLSATHVAWGAVRLEPVWMEIGEAAGLAAALAHNLKVKSTPGQLSPELLLRWMVERGFLVSFFNDVKADAEDSTHKAAQYFGTKGFFADYDARLDEPLKKSTAKVWAAAAASMKHPGSYDASAVAREVMAAEAAESEMISLGEFLSMAGVAGGSTGPQTRGWALKLLYVGLDLKWPLPERLRE